MPSNLVAKYDPYNPDARSLFLERCYNSKVREWEVIYMDTLLRRRTQSIHEIINNHFSIIMPQILKSKNKKLSRTLKLIKNNNQDPKDQDYEMNLV